MDRKTDQISGKTFFFFFFFLENTSIWAEITVSILTEKRNASSHFSGKSLLPPQIILSSYGHAWNLIYMRSENDGTLLTCQPTTRFHVHRFTKVKSRTSSRVLVLNVGLSPTLQKFRSALAQYANRSSPQGFISDDPHIV